MVKTAIRLANRYIELAQRVDCDADIDQRLGESQAFYSRSEFSSQTEQEVLNREGFGFLCEAVNKLPEQMPKKYLY